MIRPNVFASVAFALFALPGLAADPGYKIEAPQVIHLKMGQPASARLTVVPRADSHVSPDAPVSLTLTASPSVELSKLKLGRADAKETPQKGIQFDFPVAAKQAGPGSVDADLVFFLCTEKLCERHKEHVRLDVQAE